MKEERQLLEQIGNENPFRTPEGYFDTFTAELMQKLPERDYATGSVTPSPHRRHRWLAPAIAVAAVAAAFFIIPTLHTPQLAAVDNGDAYYDDMADYMSTSLYDEYTLFCYLTEDDEY